MKQLMDCASVERHKGPRKLVRMRSRAIEVRANWVVVISSATGAHSILCEPRLWVAMECHGGFVFFVVWSS